MASPALAERTYTAEEFEQLPDRKAFELRDGILEERNVSIPSSKTAGRFVRRLDEFVEANDLGHVCDSSIGLRIFPGRPDRVPRPDAAFISFARLPRGAEGGMLTVAPELIVEVVSPGDRAVGVEAKVAEYFTVDVRQVWVAYPEARRVHIHTPDGLARILSADDTLDGGDILPGFSAKVASLFPA